MEKAPALDPMPPYEPCMVVFYRGAPAPGAPVVPTPLMWQVQTRIHCSFPLAKLSVHVNGQTLVQIGLDVLHLF